MSRQDDLRAKHVALKRQRNAAGIKSAQKLSTEMAEEYARQQAEGGLHLTPEQLDSLMQLTPAEMHVWNLICQGRPPRHATTILSGIKLKLEYTRKKPESLAERGVAPVTVVIQTLGEEPPKVAVTPANADEGTVQ